MAPLREILVIFYNTENMKIITSLAIRKEPWSNELNIDDAQSILGKYDFSLN